MASVLTVFPSCPKGGPGRDAASRAGSTAQPPAPASNENSQAAPAVPGQAPENQSSSDQAPSDQTATGQPTKGQTKNEQPANAQPATARPASEKPASGHPASGKKVGPDKRPARAPAAPPAPGGPPRRIVVREGSTDEPEAQIVPGMTPEQANRQRRTTEELLAGTGQSLKRLAGRTLNADQQETVGQVRSFMEGARSALQKGDPQRARNLALKAYLLSDELVKH